MFYLQPWLTDIYKILLHRLLTLVGVYEPAQFFFHRLQTPILHLKIPLEEQSSSAALALSLWLHARCSAGVKLTAVLVI